MLRWHRGYLISVVFGARGSSTRATAKAGAKDAMTISIYDIQNQFVGESSILKYTKQYTEINQAVYQAVY